MENSIHKYYMNSVHENQKQSPKTFFKKRCSKKFREIHKETPVSESFFKKVAGMKTPSKH